MAIVVRLACLAGGVVLMVVVGCGDQDSVSEHVDEASTATLSTSETLESCRRSHATSLVLRAEVTADLLPAISEQSQLESLEIYDSRFSPGQIEALAKLRNLRRLRLEDVRLRDQDVPLFASLAGLEILNIPQTELSDAGLKQLLSLLPRLELMRFGSSSVSDEGIASMAELPRLRFLHLLHVPITDAGLKHFHGLQGLESLYIDDGQETESGIRELLQANPQLHFHRNQVHIAEDLNADEH